MRRVAGTFLIFAALSGCSFPQQGPQGSMLGSNRPSDGTGSWPSSGNRSLTGFGSGSDSPMWGAQMGNQLVSASPATTPPAFVSGPTQMASKTTATTDMAAGQRSVMASSYDMGATTTNAETGGIVRANYDMSQQLMGAYNAGDRAALDKILPGTTQQVSDSSSPPSAPNPPSTRIPPPTIVKADSAVVPASMTVVEGTIKQTPASVSLDTKTAIAGMPALKLVNTKRFSLTFSVQDNGTGVAAIDLWETRDGKTWKKAEGNAHQQSGTYLVEVKDEGVFGYTMVARPTGDKGSTQPKIGEVPQVWVTVDVTKPTVQLKAVNLNLISKTPSLVVSWEAKDKNFGPRPITLCYAEKLEGPWLPLAANIENSGKFECPIPATMPKKAFLRVEAVDLVGNTGTQQTEKQVRLDFSAPAPASLLPAPPYQQAAEPTRPPVIINTVEPGTLGRE